MIIIRINSQNVSLFVENLRILKNVSFESISSIQQHFWDLSTQRILIFLRVYKVAKPYLRPESSVCFFTAITRTAFGNEKPLSPKVFSWIDGAQEFFFFLFFFLNTYYLAFLL